MFHISTQHPAFLAVMAVLGVLIGAGPPSALASDGSQSVCVEHSGPGVHVTSIVRSPYGNPFTDFLRRPYGVLSSPIQQATLPPVHDNPSEPFDWYRYPRAAIGVFGGPEESIVTPKGYLRTHFGTLRFATGKEGKAVNQRVKTWKDGYLPILEEQFARSGVKNHIEFFAAKVPGVAKIEYSETYGNPTRSLVAPVDNMVNFVKVTLTNTRDRATSYHFSARLGPRHLVPSGDQRGSSKPAHPTWNANGKSYGGDGKLLFVAAQSPTAVHAGTLDYSVKLAPGATKSLVFKMPYFVARQSDRKAIQGADYGTYLAKTARFWHKTLDQAGTRIQIPGPGVESKVLDTYKANLAFSLLLVNIVDGHYFWRGNPTIYDHYYIRDAAFDIDGLLDAGVTDVARHLALAMLSWQKRNGLFISQSTELDGNGQALWTFGNYYSRTHDKRFARRVWPAVQKAMAWEWHIRRENWKSAGGLMPVSRMWDASGVRGYVLAYDLWNIVGEWGAVQIAKAVGADATAKKWRKRRAQYIDILHEKLKPTVNYLGWIPPALKAMRTHAIRTGWYGNVYGIDWGNLEVVWPSAAFTPDDPWVTQSLNVWRKKTFEGLFGYPYHGVESTLHSYTPMYITQTYIRRGDQWKAIEDLYGLLTHTSATDMVAEGLSAAQRWGWHENTQTMPHPTFSGEYRSMLHDMLAYAGQDGALHLANVWSPVWAKPGRRIAFAGETDFGHAAYTIRVRSDGATMHLDPPTRNAPKNIIVSVPQNDVVTGVTVGGKRIDTFKDNRITLSALRHPATIKIAWKQQQAAPPYSFARAVKDYLANYHKMTSPLDVRVEKLAVDHATVHADDKLQVKATIVNTGGAGDLADSRIRLYIDGKPAQTDKRTLAKGIGFTTPKEIISFDHKSEGVVPVGFTTTFCNPGKHTLGIALGTHRPAQTVTVDVLSAQSGPTGESHQ
jgi:hypothetical protein